MPLRIKEEERIERIIRGLLKLPENKRCINCNSLGPQYVCTTFWTFVCTNCSGVHREFTHRVKSVSMATFTADEVAALQAGGNERAREVYLKTWDPKRNSFPDSRNLHGLRNFIKHVYMDRKYAGEMNNGKLLMDKAVAKDEYHQQDAFKKSSLRDDFFERRSFERTVRGQRDDLFERHSFDKSSPSMKPGERPLRYDIENRNSPRYRQGKLRSASHKIHAAHFEIVDDRFREDGFGTVKRYENPRYSTAESRAQSSSPVSLKSRDMRSPPPIHSLKDILGDNAPRLKVGEPPKANDGGNVDGSAHVQKATSSTGAGSIDKREEESKTVTTSSLIDFDANPEPAASTTMVPSQQKAPSSDGGNSSSASFTNEKASNNPNVNSMEYLLFELGGPAIASAGSSPSECPPSGDTPSAASVRSLNIDAGTLSGSTISPPVPSNDVGTTHTSTENDPVFLNSCSNSIAKVTDAKQLPPTQQIQSFAVPTGNNSPMAQQTTSSLHAVYNQPSTSEPILNNGPPTDVSSEQSSQAVSKLAQVSSSGNESVLSGRQELPADLFASGYSSFAAAVPGWQFHPPYGMEYGVQYHPRAMPSHETVRSRNPFDLAGDGPQPQATIFPSMSPLQGALPGMSVPSGLQPQASQYASALLPQGNSFGMMTPPGSYMGQSPNNMMPSRPQGVNNFGISDDAFASLNPIQQSGGIDPASGTPNFGMNPALATHNSFPSTGGNPFG